jgi:cell division protein FtsQ
MTVLSIDPRLQARRIEVLRLRGRRRLRLILTLTTLILVTLLARWVILESPLFDVDGVTIEGASNTAVAEALDVAGVVKGQALLQVDISAAREAIIALPWVESVTSDRGLGGDVTFTISERSAVAVVPAESGWLLVDAQGRVLDGAATIPAGVVVVDGSTWAVAPGGWIGEGALPALDVAALLPSGLRSKVASVHATQTDLELVLFGGGRVNLGDATDLDQKFLSALTMVVQLDLACLDSIDVRAPSVPVLTRTAGCS